MARWDFMKPMSALVFALATAFIGCSTARPARLVLINPTTGGRFVGEYLPSGETSMSASIEINGVHFRGTFDPSRGDEVALLVGTGSDLLHCKLHVDAKTQTGVGECVQAGHQRFDVTLSAEG